MRIVQIRFGESEQKGMWREMIKQLEPHATFTDGVTAERLEQLERALTLPLPMELRALLSESDGVTGQYGLHLIWSTDEIEKLNLQVREQPGFRSTYMPLDSLLFFADAGDGEWFALCIIEGSIKKPDVYVWNPIDDSRTWVAPSIQKYLDWWLTGKLKL